MRIIARRTLREFVESRAGHRDRPALKAALDAWFDEVKAARWASTVDVKRLYATATERPVRQLVTRSHSSEALDVDESVPPVPPVSRPGGAVQRVAAPR